MSKNEILNINLPNKVDHHFKKKVWEIMREKFDLTACYQCGYCDQMCPIHQRYLNYSPRNIVLFGLLGYKNAVIYNKDPLVLWGCTDCDTCDEICPEKIPITEIIQLFKEESIKAGTAPKYYQDSAEIILMHGMAIPEQKAILKRREKLGLNKPLDIPIDEIKVLLDETELPKLLKDIEKTNSIEK